MRTSCPSKGLAGAAEAAPGKGLAGGTCFVPLLFVVLALALLWLPRASVLPRFTSPVLLGAAVGAAPTVRAQVKGYKGVPLLLYTDIKFAVLTFNKDRPQSNSIQLKLEK